MRKSLVLLALLQTLNRVSLFTLECNFKTDDWRGIGSVYSCNNDKGLPESSGDTITAVKGKHETGKTNDDVTALHISGENALTFFPRGASKFFPNLKGVACFFMRAKLNGSELDEFGSRLQVFAYEISYLTTIPSRLFRNTPNVIEVSFETNMISKVGRDLFAPLDITKLKHVNMGNNACINRDESGEENVTALIKELKELCPHDD